MPDTAAQADAITDQGNPWMFQINNTVSGNSRAFNSYLVNTLKPKTVAYMGENTEFNKTVLENLKESLKAANIELVNVSTYDAETNDFTSILTKLKSVNPDLLYVSDAYPARAAQLWKQVRQLGGFPKEVMSPGVVTPGMLKPAEGTMDGVITGNAMYADLMANLWNLHEQDKPERTRDAYSKFLLMRNAAQQIPGADLYVMKKRGVFKTAAARREGGKAAEANLSPEAVAEIDFRFAAIEPYLVK